MGLKHRGITNKAMSARASVQGKIIKKKNQPAIFRGLLFRANFFGSITNSQYTHKEQNHVNCHVHTNKVEKTGKQ